MESVESKEHSRRLPRPLRITEQVWTEGTVPVVSVFNWAYNHVDFIRESIDSILMQETTFPVEIIIHDDASTDGTTEIIREYEAKYPQLFRNIIQTENQWSQGKSVMDPMFTAPRGEFLALAHGDDYWTSPSKLEEQVGILNADPTVSLVFHNCWMMYPESRRDWFLNHRIEKERFTLVDVIEREWFMGTASLVFRKFDPLPPEISRYAMGGDMLIQLGACLNGDALYLDHVYSVYRRHAEGVSDRYWQPGLAHYEILRPNHIWMYWQFRQLACPLKAKEAVDRKISGLMSQVAQYLLTSHVSAYANPQELDSRFRSLLMENKPPSVSASVLESGGDFAELCKAQTSACWRAFRKQKNTERRNRIKAKVGGVLRTVRHVFGE